MSDKFEQWFKSEGLPNPYWEITKSFTKDQAKSIAESAWNAALSSLQGEQEAAELNKLEQDYEDLNRDYCLVLASRDSLLKENSNLKAYQKHEKSLAQEMFLQEINDLRQEVECLKSVPQPDPTKLIGELVEAILKYDKTMNEAIRHRSEITLENEEYALRELNALLAKAREAIK